MDYELITFEATDCYGCSYNGSVVVDITQDIDRQVSKYLSINVCVQSYKGISENFYSF